MFTGIVSGVGTLHRRQDARFVIACPYKRRSLADGASIACDGCCLTIVEVAKGKGEGARFTVEASNETLARTTLGTWAEGRRINLERALALGDELGGHLVTGHIDGLATLLARERDGESVRVMLEGPAHLAPFIAAKGSVALDGVSLTVNEVDGSDFAVSVIPHTLAQTTLGATQVGTKLNLEVDPIARYVVRLQGA